MKHSNQKRRREIAYQTIGTGSPIVLLHPFPVHHEFWLFAAQALSNRYQLILPDLRGHGDSTFMKARPPWKNMRQILSGFWSNT